MKNILICGVAKSGKSYLANKLCKKYKYNHIPIDYFTSSFKHNFPEIGITSNIIIDKASFIVSLSIIFSHLLQFIFLFKTFNIFTSHNIHNFASYFY